jgi:hypothetical protein
MDLIITEIPKTKQTLCLNMIVKNEAHIIIDTLKNICSYFQFDYWVISDTGSTDNTKELITTFFEELYIPGELVEHQWVDFGYNRSKALESAYNKTDYLLIFDADDSIVGNFKMPNTLLTADKYMLKFGQGFEYMRPLLITNKKKWCFKGVLHEYLACNEPSSTEDRILGDYYLNSGRLGNRSKNPNKYHDDAMVLEKGFVTEMLPGGDTGMAHRYAFYCAQSYKDSGSTYVDKAIEWYSKVLDLDNWHQEKYYACCQLGDLYKSKNNMVNAVKYWLKSIEYDKERIEGVVSACEYYYTADIHLLVNSLYERFKHYNKSLQGKLFINQDQYKDELEYYNSISAYYANNKESGYESCKRIIINNIIVVDKIKLTIKNIMFYKELLNKDTKINIAVLLKSVNVFISKTAVVENYISELQSLLSNIIEPSNKVELSTTEDVKPSTTEDVKPSTTEDVKPSNTEDVEPSTKVELSNTVANVNELFNLVVHYKNKNDWTNALKYYTLIKEKYDANESSTDNNKEIYSYKNEYEYSIFAYYCGIRNINDSIIKIFTNCDNYSIISNVLSNMKFYKFILTAQKVIELKLSLTHAINGVEYFFYSSSSCIIPNNNEDGYAMNVRLINYRIDNNGNYVDWGGEHIYTMNLYIELNKNFDITSKKLLKINNENRINRNIGIDDIRIHRDNNKLLFIGAAYDINNQCGAVYGSYDIEDKDVLYPVEIKPEFNKESLCEKNWVYINYKGETSVIYNWYPIKICKINTETNLLELVETKNDVHYPLFFKHVRGSTCAYEYNNEFWFIVHIVSYENPRHYYHFIVVFDKNMNLLRYSAPFKFEDECIEYCIGLIIETDRVIATYSTMDRTTKIALYDKSYIDGILIYKNKSDSLINKSDSLINKSDSLIDKSDSLINKSDSLIDKSDKLILNNGKPNIAILVPVCSRNKNFVDINDTPIMSYLYPSFLKTTNDDSVDFNYTFFIGYDDDDEFYIKNESELRKVFKNVYMLSECQHAPAYAWNKLADIAYKSTDVKYDYFFQVGDDIVLQTENWTTQFVTQLNLHNNIGVVGPCNLANYNARMNSNKPYVIENAFVSRKHLDIFGTFFHPSIKNWYCDDWITQVYSPYFSEIQTNILCINSIYDSRYDIELCRNIETLIEESRTMIKHKKIFSYCIYGKHEKYCLGMVKNIEQITTLFPDFEIWITLGNDVPNDYIQKYKTYKNVHLIETAVTGGRLMTFRFFGIDDPTVDIMLVRDADSRFSERDIWCITHFIESEFKMFTIRDHKYHLREIMGGQCGIKKQLEGEITLREHYNEHVKSCADLDYYNNDQDFISKILYYPYKKDIIVYTSTQQFSEEVICPIPILRKNDKDFCGNVVEFDDNKNEYVIFNVNGKI